MTSVDVLKEAAARGLSLSRFGEKLRVIPAARLTPEFAEILSSHKSYLLAMLSWPFVMVQSKALGGDLVFFCEDEATKAALVGAGAPALSIYTKEELRILVAQNRIKPFTDAELRKIHEIKRSLGAKIVPEEL
jgi:hypothetical protein